MQTDRCDCSNIDTCLEMPCCPGSFVFCFLNLSCSAAEACLCSTKEESDILLLLRSVFNFIYKATGLHEVKYLRKERKYTGYGRQWCWGTWRAQKQHQQQP